MSDLEDYVEQEVRSGSSRINAAQRLGISSAVYREDKSVQMLCESNAITEELFLNKNQEITRIEMSHFTFSKIEGLNYFSNLKDVCLIAQDITTIDGFETCVHLESLWICEAKIQKIQGLSNCVRLKSLYLYSNQIAKIEGLEKLVKLETLWLNDNKISRLEGLEKLTSLKTLWIASNQIKKIANSLCENSKLCELNLANNLIGHLGELTCLASLENLDILYLSDSNFGDNPVCHLCNYQTHVLYNLKHIQKLDGLGLTEENKRMAEATFTKKRMYYYMKIKYLRRVIGEILKEASKGRNDTILQVETLINPVILQLKELDHEKETNGVTDVLLSKYQQLSDYCMKYFHELSRLEERFAKLKSSLTDYQIIETKRILMELETGGNIRLESGKYDESWVLSCSDLLQSRFFPQDFAQYGVETIIPTRIVRIHNRFLRNRFEQSLAPPPIRHPINSHDWQALGQETEELNAQKPHIEYLFYVEPVVSNNLNVNESSEKRKVDTKIFSIENIIEHGFPSAEEYELLGLDSAIPLSNSVSACRISNLGQNSKLPMDSPTGRILVVKAFLGRTTSELGKEGGCVCREGYVGYDSVYKIKQGDPKQRTWFVFDYNTLLPEYVIDLEFVQSPMKAFDVRSGGLEEKIDKLRKDIEGLRLGSLQNGVDENPEDDDEIKSYTPNAAFVDEHRRLLGKFALECKSVVTQVHNDPPTSILNLPPTPSKFPPIFIITEEVVLRLGKATIFSAISYLNFLQSGISKIENLSLLVNLKTLILSHNEIKKIEGLQDLHSLETLDLSFNQLRRIEGVKGLNSLKTFLLASNYIYRMEDINLLKKYIPQLTKISLRGNPLVDARGYKILLLRRLSHLSVLDDFVLTEEEKSMAREKSATLTSTSILEHSFAQKRSSQERMVGDLSNAVSCLFVVEEIKSDIWMEKIVELDLRGCSIRRLQNLEKLVNLKRADFRDNLIGRIEGLDSNLMLKDLCFEENRIIRIDGLSKLTNLKKLDLGKNQIQTIEGLETLTNLTQLSLEDNSIYSLSGLNVVSLMELYLANNHVSNVKEILHLKDMTKLVILDLSGNLICNSPDFRLYVIHRVRKLKVLDGIIIEGNELNAARDQFTGRLTVELLEEKVGSGFLQHVRDVDLSSMRLREIETLSADEFPHLRELTLDNNNLTTLRGLHKLVNLTILRANQNKIETLGLCPHEFPENDKLPPTWGMNLEVLELSHNQITNIPSLHLHLFRSLKVLILSGNQITKVEGLEGLEQLRKLVLDKNRIKSLDDAAFSPLKNLQALCIDENTLRSFQGITNLTHLKFLSIVQNRITEVAELNRLVMPSLSEIAIQGNAVARKNHYRYQLIVSNPNLAIIDGKTVTDDERDRAGSFLNTNGLANINVDPQIFYQTLPYQENPNASATSTAPRGKVPLTTKVLDFSYISGLGKEETYSNEPLSISPHKKIGLNSGSPNINHLGFNSINNNNNNNNNANNGINLSPTKKGGWKPPQPRIGISPLWR